MAAAARLGFRLNPTGKARISRAAALLLVPTGTDTCRSLSGATNIRSMFSAFAGRLLAARKG